MSRIDGKYAADFVPYLEKIGSESLVDDENFKRLLKEAAQKDKIMKDTQDSYSLTSFTGSLPLNLVKETNLNLLSVCLLSTIHIFIQEAFQCFSEKDLRNLHQLMVVMRKNGLTSYVDVRHQWLKYHEKPILRKTIYRTQVFINEMERGNWNLEKLPIDVNGVKVK